jgi:hypothetical protein
MGDAFWVSEEDACYRFSQDLTIASGGEKMKAALLRGPGDIITSRIKLGEIVKKGFDVLTSPGHNEIKIIVELDV